MPSPRSKNTRSETKRLTGSAPISTASWATRKRTYPTKERRQEIAREVATWIQTSPQLAPDTTDEVEDDEVEK